MRPEQLSILKILWRSGTQQSDRLAPALDPEHIRLMDLDPQDWMLFAQNFGRYIPFFSEQFPSKVIGYWSKFFEQVLSEEPIPQKGTPAFNSLKGRLKASLEELEASSSLTPHLGLMLSFFKLMDFPKSRINRLSRRHLDFYFKEILQLQKKGAKPDQVYLILELAKIPQVRIPKDTQFEAGKDLLGKKLVYKSTSEYYPNQAKLAAQKNRYVDGVSKKAYFSEIANSFDGNGADFPQGLPKWWPFGHPQLPSASFGFTLATAALNAPEGAKRFFSFSFEFENKHSILLTPQELNSIFHCEFSGEKGWIPIKPSLNTVLGNFTSRMEFKKLKLSFIVEEALPALVEATPKIHGDLETSGTPLVRFMVKPLTPRGFDFLRSLSNNFLQTVTIKSSIQGIHAPILESDLGVLQAEKPFMPFSAVPKKGSSFYLDELFWKNKNLIKITLSLKWANTPEKFKDLYFGYRNLSGQNFSKDTYVAQNFVGLTPSIKIKELMLNTSEFKNALKNKNIQINPTPTNLIVNEDSYFTLDVSVRNSVNWNRLSGTRILFSKDGQQFVTNVDLSNNSGLKANGGLKLTLNQSFLHELYPKLYALAMASEQPETLIPNEPYTPLVEQLTLGYETAETFSMDQDTDLKLFRRDDFGFFEEKRSKKEALVHVTQKRLHLVSFPTVNGGELFLHFTDLQPNQQLSILFQVLEGSENPANAVFRPQDRIRWSVLINDYWFTLENRHVLSDETDNFLKSGIIVFQLPEAAFGSHTRMTHVGVWLRAYSSKPFDATSKMVATLPQAIKATFVDKQNDLSHLGKGLPPQTISKMTERISGVKSVYQPFNSFGESPQESDTGFYTHVAERLRHKNRALSLWDYEHLVLDHFPEVFKVKCLNHTNSTSFTAPGSLLILVIPDTLDKNVFDIFQPMFSTAKLNEIRDFLKERVSPALEILVDNPTYEEVRIQLGVRFRSGLDPAFYRNRLESDIIQYLSPWAVRSENSIAFGVNLQESLLIHHLEKLSYLEYLQDLVIYKNNQTYRKRLEPSSPKNILVSAKNHTILPI